MGAYGDLGVGTREWENGEREVRRREKRAMPPCYLSRKRIASPVQVIKVKQSVKKSMVALLHSVAMTASALTEAACIFRFPRASSSGIVLSNTFFWQPDPLTAPRFRYGLLLSPCSIAMESKRSLWAGDSLLTAGTVEQAEASVDRNNIPTRVLITMFLPISFDAPCRTLSGMSTLFLSREFDKCNFITEGIPLIYGMGKARAQNLTFYGGWYK